MEKYKKTQSGNLRGGRQIRIVITTSLILMFLITVLIIGSLLYMSALPIASISALGGACQQLFAFSGLNVHQALMCIYWFTVLAILIRRVCMPVVGFSPVLGNWYVDIYCIRTHAILFMRAIHWFAAFYLGGIQTYFRSLSSALFGLLVFQVYFLCFWDMELLTFYLFEGFELADWPLLGLFIFSVVGNVVQTVTLGFVSIARRVSRRGFRSDNSCNAVVSWHILDVLTYQAMVCLYSIGYWLANPVYCFSSVLSGALVLAPITSALSAFLFAHVNGFMSHRAFASGSSSPNSGSNSPNSGSNGPGEFRRLPDVIRRRLVDFCGFSLFSGVFLGPSVTNAPGYVRAVATLKSTINAVISAAGKSSADLSGVSLLGFFLLRGDPQGKGILHLSRIVARLAGSNGVYFILCAKTGSLQYVGQSVDFPRRVRVYSQPTNWVGDVSYKLQAFLASGDGTHYYFGFIPCHVNVALHWDGVSIRSFLSCVQFQQELVSYYVTHLEAIFIDYLKPCVNEGYGYPAYPVFAGRVDAQAVPIYVYCVASGNLLFVFSSVTAAVANLPISDVTLRKHYNHNTVDMAHNKLLVALDRFVLRNVLYHPEDSPLYFSVNEFRDSKVFMDIICQSTHEFPMPDKIVCVSDDGHPIGYISSKNEASVIFECSNTPIANALAGRNSTKVRAKFKGKLMYYEDAVKAYPHFDFASLQKFTLSGPTVNDQKVN